MISKKYIIAAGVVSVMLASGLVVLAEDTANMGGSAQATIMPPVKAQPQVVEIGPQGNVLLRGTISAVNANSLTVKSWGGDWMVNTTSSTTLAPKAADMTQFVVGDFVGVQGKVSTSAAWTVDATLVRDWNVRQEAQANRKDIKDVIKAITARNWEGVVVGDINADDSFKLQVGSTTYDVKMATGAKVVDKNFLTLAESSIKAGDSVRVYGPATDTTITASVIRDVSWDLKKGTK